MELGLNSKHTLKWKKGYKIMYRKTVVYLLTLLSAFLFVDSKWNGFSYDNSLCKDQSCFRVTSFQSEIKTTPVDGTCGERREKRVIDSKHGNWINCKHECPNKDLTYPRSGPGISQHVLDEFELWSRGCSSSQSSAVQCFYEQYVRNFDQSTYAFWIKPLEDVRKGVLVSFNIYPGTSILMINNSLVMYVNALNMPYFNIGIYIPTNQWTHLGLQLFGIVPEMDFFINGTYTTSFHVNQPIPVKRKKRQEPSEKIALGVYYKMFDFHRSYYTHPLKIEKCKDIGYSASVTFLCVENSISDKHLHLFTNCSDPNLSLQSYLASTYFSDDHEWSVYKCQYDRKIVSLFTCGYFLPAYSHEDRTFGLFPCKSLCEEFFENCGNYIKNIPNLNSSCALYPQTNCISRDYVPEVGTYKAIIKNFNIYSTHLTFREMKVHGDMNINQLPVVEPLTNCLCPSNLQELLKPDNLLCILNPYKSYDSWNPWIVKQRGQQPVYRLGDRRNLDYHFKKYVLDSDQHSNWISAPGLEVVSLDISFKDIVQILGVSIQMVSAAPVYTSSERFPMELYLLDISHEWKLVAVLTNESMKCREILSNRPGSVKCFVYNEIKTTLQNLTTYNVDLLNDMQKYYSETYMHKDIVALLRAKGLRMQFNGFSKDKNQYPDSTHLYHVVTDITIQGRYFNGTTMCGCYPDGTDLSLSCNTKTLQCPCHSRYHPYIGRTCHPYIHSIRPGYGPKSGGTEIEILGGVFGHKQATVHILIGNNELNVEILSYNDTVIKIKTSMLDNDSYSDIIEQPLNISVKLQSGYAIPTNATFTYKEDPVVHSIHPLTTFLQGGISQTVIGKHLNSVYRPYLNITFVDEELKYEPIQALCSNVNDTVMICPSPDLSSIERVVGITGDSEQEITDNKNSKKYRRDIKKTDYGNTESSYVDTNTTVRFKISNDVRVFYVGLTLDGVQKYHNLTESIGTQYGKMAVFINPKFEKFNPEILMFKPYKGDKHLYIHGSKLNLGCGKKDYMISIGAGKCQVLDLNLNQVVCKAPAEVPQSSTLLMKNGAYKVVCQVGNIRINLGYMKYCMNALCEAHVLAGVVIGCIIALLALLLCILLLLYKFGIIKYKCFHNKNKEPEEQTVKYRNPQELVSLVSNEFESETSFLNNIKEYNISLYETIIKFQLESSNMSLGKQIGEGHFGSVNEGYYLLNGEDIHVAIKPLKAETDNIDKLVEFLEEGTIMTDFKHKNVLTILGMVIEHETPYIVLPFMEYGDLKCYLSNPSNQFNFGDLLGYATQLARGMSYLSDLHFVHRDLAARNCMINKDQVVKIADFGLSRDINEKDYYTVQNKSRPMPVKWMAIECLDNFKFTSKSDVWSFGVTLWEISMRGCVPFLKVPNCNIKEYILRGNRLHQPPFCPDVIYSLMLKCWDHNPDRRPIFSEIVTRLEEFLKNAKRVHEQGPENIQDEDLIEECKSMDQQKVYDTKVGLNGEYSQDSVVFPPCAPNKTNNKNETINDGYLAPVKSN